MSASKLKKLLSMGLVCAMLTPVVSFATNDTATDTADTTTDTANESNETATTDSATTDSADGGITKGTTGVDFIDKINPSSISTDGMTQEGVTTALNYLIASTSERQKLAYEAAKEAPVADTTLKSDDVFDAEKVIDGHMFVTESEEYELYVEPDSLSIIIRDKNTGTLLRSSLEDEEAYVRNSQLPSYAMTTSGITINPVKYDPTSETRSGMYDKVNTKVSSRDATITYKAIENGFLAHLHFDNHGNDVSLNGLNLEFDLKVTLDETGMHVSIPDESINENDKEDEVCYLMGDVYIFPLLGYTDRGDTDGYMMLPDGNGIIVNFDDFYQDGTAKYKSGYSVKVYGTDVSMVTASTDDTTKERKDLNPVEEVIAPYFGMVHDYSAFNDGDNKDNIAVLGFVESGEYSCTINGMLNGVNATFENYSYVSATYRETYQELTDNNKNSNASKTEVTESLIEDFEVTYLFASGDDADYAGLANKCRDLLIENGTLQKADDLDYETRVDFLGLDKENFLIFRRNVVATTIEQIDKVINLLKNKGVDNISVYYDGWQEGGMYDLPNTEYKIADALGGNDEFEDIQDKYQDVHFSVIQDMLNINTVTSNSTFSAMKMINKRTYEYTDRFLEVYKTFRYLAPSKTAENLKALAADMLDDDMVNLTIKGFTNELFTYSLKSVIHSRKDAMDTYTDALEKVRAQGLINVSMVDPNMYLWKYTDEYLDLPISSSMYVYASEEIPFLSTILKGSMKVFSEYVNFEANQTEFFLKLIETGVYPSYLLTYESPTILQYTNSSWVYSSDYAQYVPLIAEHNKDLQLVNDKTEGAYIVDHQMHYDGIEDLTKVTYDNGVVVYVNYSEEAVSADGKTIDGLSYKVGEE